MMGLKQRCSLETGSLFQDSSSTREMVLVLTKRRHFQILTNNNTDLNVR